MTAKTSKTNRSAKLSESGLSMMRANSTRLELIIVAAVLLVLLFSNRTPRSGNAEVRTRNAEMSAQMPSMPQESAPTTPASMQRNVETARPGEMLPVDAQPRVKRIGIVDARNSGNPRYKNLMSGEVTVRWVWNGGKFVPQKVCIVDEGNGVTSIWSFDQKNGVTITERQEPTDTPQ